MALLSRKCALLQLQCRVVAGRRVALVKQVPGQACIAARPAAPRVRTHAALLEERDVESSFTTLLDDEDEFENEEGDELYDAEDTAEPAAAVDPSLLVENLGLSETTVTALRRRGIAALFPIQDKVLRPAMEGQDLIGRAKTGSGKTLAFALPVVESLLAEDAARTGRRAPGRTPRCLILAPTRELAKQVASEFESVCPSLKVVSFYGGTSITAQIGDLRRGVDVVVGTPGRVMDLLDRKALSGEKVRFVVLDEADQMLDMGFEEDMEVILQQMPAQRQTMLFSATLPHWVNKVARRYQQNPITIDLVGESQTGKLNEDVTLNIMQVSQSEKRQALVDLINVYAAGGKAIVFTKTKLGADEVAAAISAQQPCEALHGDIAQAQREKTLGRFRAGDVTVLIATDVAARGLDIPNVDLIVHYDIPQDSESFLHRSGRTGRAGNKGRAIVLFTPGETRSLGLILQQVKLASGDVIGAPTPADVMASASRTVLSKLDRVDANVIEFFMPAATRLISSPQPERLLAAALAAMSGFRNVTQERSLLTGEVGMVTLKLQAAAGRLDGFTSTARIIEKLLGTNVSGQIGRLRLLTAPGDEGVAVDLPANQAAAVLAATDAAADMSIIVSRPTSLPLDVKEMVLGRKGGRPPHSDRSISPRRSYRGGGGQGYRGNSGGGSGNRDYNRDGYGGGWGGRDGGNSRSGRGGGGAPWSGRGRSGGSSGGSSGGGGGGGWGERGSSSRGAGGGGSRGGGKGNKGAIW